MNQLTRIFLCLRGGFNILTVFFASLAFFAVKNAFQLKVLPKVCFC